jgi:hypothetical protein
MAGVWTKNQIILLTHRQFSQMKKCVYGMYLLLPESIRKNVMMMVLMGILLNLRKLMGKQFYIILPLCLTLPTEL